MTNNNKALVILNGFIWWVLTSSADQMKDKGFTQGMPCACEKYMRY